MDGVKIHSSPIRGSLNVPSAPSRSCCRVPIGSTDEVTPFYSCSNLTNVSAQSSSYECANDEAVKIIYDNDDCSGEGNMTVVTLFNGTCIQGQISTCSLDGERYSVSSSLFVEYRFPTEMCQADRITCGYKN